MTACFVLASIGIALFGTYQFGRLTGRSEAFSESLEKFDSTIGKNGCACVHERAYRDEIVRGWIS